MVSWISGWMDGQVDDGWVVGQMDEWMSVDGWMVGWMSEWKDRWMEQMGELKTDPV